MAGIEQENRKMKTQEIQETARDLLAGTVYDMEQITPADAQYISDLLASQGYALRVKPEFSLVYAVPDRVH
jgi:hypothetical protein